MTKLHTKRQMASRRAVAPVIATLLLVAIAVVGGSIIFVFSQGFFSSAQISGTPAIESVELVGYDTSDLGEIYLHDGLCTVTGLLDPVACTGSHDGTANDGINQGEYIAIYVQNQSAIDVTLTELSVAGIVYDYPAAAPTTPLSTGNQPVQGEYVIITNGNTGAGATVKTDVQGILAAGEEATIYLSLEGGITEGRDAQWRVETGNGNIFVGTIIAGQHSG